jgi:hypothetical protein
MSDPIELVGSPLGLRFIIRWNGAPALAIALSTAMTAILAIGIGPDGEGPLPYLIAAAVLSFPIMSALGHGWVMRDRLKQPVLWGTLTGVGILAAFASVITVGTTLGDLWEPSIWQLAVWIGRSLGLSAPPSTFVAYAGGGLLFGLILGGTQAAALDHGWRSRLRWIAVSAAGGVPAAIWLYVCAEVDAVANGLLVRIADSLPLSGNWNIVPIAVPLAIILCLCFTLPTGLFMQRLLRRRRRADAEALVRLFE